MADVIQIPLTLDQYRRAVQALQAPNNGVKQFVTPDAAQLTGIVDTADIDFTYVYDGKAMFTMTITKRNSLKAKFASLDIIRSKMLQLIAANLS